MTAHRSDRKESRSLGRRGLRIGLYVLISLSGICLLVIVLVSTVEPIRNGILSYAMGRVGRALPGNLSTETMRWPNLGRVDISGVLWSTTDDTLLAADTLRVSVKLLPLLRRDLQVSEFSLIGLIADVQGIQSVLPDGEKREVSEEEPKSSSGFPRGGEITSIPSVAVEQFRLSAPRVRLSEDLSLIGIGLEGSIDLLKGHAPDVKVSQLCVREADGEWGADHGELRVEVAPGRVEGRILGRFGAERIALALSSPNDETVRITISGKEGVLSEGEWGADLLLRAEREGYVPRAIEMDLVLQTPGTQDLSAIPDLAGVVEGLPQLEGVRILGNGLVRAQPEPKGSLRIAIESNSWIDEGTVSLSFEDEAFRADTVSLRFPDLRIDASAAVTADQVRAKAAARVRGTTLLRRLQPDASLPDSLFANLNATVMGSTAAPAVEADLHAAFRFGPVIVDEVKARAQLPPQGPASLELSVRAMDLIARTRAEMVLSDTLTVRMAPIDVAEARGETKTRSLSSLGSTIRVHGATGDASVRGLRIRGALGDGALDGRYSSPGSGSFRLSWTWSQPPQPLMSRLPLENHVRDSLAARWGRGEAFHLFAEGTLGTEGDVRSLQAKGRFILPGPRVWGSIFLPPQAEVGDLGPVRGRFGVTSRDEPSGSSMDATLDLNETEWIEDARIVVGTSENATSLDTLSFKVEGLDLKAEGTIRGDSLSLRARLEAAYEGLIRRAIGDTTLDASLSLQANLSGSRGAPDAQVALKGRGAYGRYIVPEITGDLSFGGGGLETLVEAKKGVDLDQIQLDVVTVRATSEGDSLVPLVLTLMASGPDLEVFNALRLSMRRGWVVDVDSLRCAVRGLDLATVHPFRLGLDLEEGSLSIERLDLRGGIGRVQAQGFMNPDSSDLKAEVSAVFPEKPPFLDLPEDLWPEKMDLTLQLQGRAGLHGDVEVTGFHLADRRNLTARLVLDAEEGAARGSLSVGNNSGALLSGRAHMPVTISTYPFRADFGREDLFAEIILENTPIPVDDLTGGAGEESRIVKLGGSFVLGGTFARPTGGLTLHAAFPDWPRLSRYGLHAQAELNGPGDSSAETDPSAARSDTTQTGLSSSLSLLRNEKQILTANARLPMRLSLHPYALLIPEGRPMEAHMDAEKLDLSDFNGLMPPDVEIGGDVGLQLAASGPTDDPDLAGELRADKLRVSMANGTRTVADARLRLSGTGRKPEVQGRIEILNGVIRIPEEQRILHSTSGEALLWEVEELRPPPDLEEPSPDSGEGPKAAGASEPPELVEMTLDVAVVIPSGLWIRGRGLEVELAGELNVEQKGKTLPTITGRLNAVRGQLVFLGRIFRIEKGEVVFYGGDEIDPSVDLLLSARVGDVVIRILFTGTAQQPVLELTSDPEMTEGDIMAYLLFGRPLEELSSNQSEFLQSRAVDVAASYPLAKLEERLARSLGVDMMSIRRAEGTDSQSALVVGKYLTRRALFKYEQALESATSFFINLEYMLSRHFKLETLIGTQGKSGIEIGWSR